jgi:ABC-type multidrug transport system fused ATPase/permease subunit
MNLRAAGLRGARCETTGAIVDVHANIGTVKAYGDAHSARKTHAQIESEKCAFVRLGWWDVLTFNFQGLCIVFLCAGLILITAFLFDKGAVTIGEIVFISAAALRIFTISREGARASPTS